MPPQGLGPGEMAARWVIGNNMYRVPTRTKGLPGFRVSGTFGMGDPKNETSNARPPPKPLHLTIGNRQHDPRQRCGSLFFALGTMSLCKVGPLYREQAPLYSANSSSLARCPLRCYLLQEAFPDS